MLVPVQILRSPPGTRFVYWTGHSLQSARLENEQLDMLATWLFHANAAGYVWLFQRRVSDGEFAWEAVRSSLELTPEQARLLIDGTGELRNYGRPHADVELAGAFLLGEQTRANAIVAWAAHLGCGGKAERCRNYDTWRLDCPGGGSTTGRRLHKPRTHTASGSNETRLRTRAVSSGQKVRPKKYQTARQ